MDPTNLVDSSHSINTPTRVAPPRGRARGYGSNARVSRAATTHARTPVTALDILILRAWARARLWEAGELSLHDAVDTLWFVAEASGLVDQLDADEIQRIIAEQFQPVR
jgi:hypothetical protein